MQPEVASGSAGLYISTYYVAGKVDGWVRDVAALAGSGSRLFDGRAKKLSGSASMELMALFVVVVMVLLPFIPAATQQIMHTDLWGESKRT